jgi:hypothetical protein
MIPSMSDEIPELPEHAADLEVEQALGKGIPYDPEAGIKAMEARLKGLSTELENAQNAEDAARIRRQYQDAQARLAQYKLQRDGKN